MNKHKAMNAIWALFDKDGKTRISAKPRDLSNTIGSTEAKARMAMNQLLERELVAKRFGKLELTELGKDAKRGRAKIAENPDRPRGGRTEFEQEVYGQYRRREISAEKFGERINEAQREKRADRAREEGGS